MTTPPETLMPMHLQEPQTLSPQKRRRIYAGSPERIKVSSEGDLQSGEVYITHRRILDEVDCCTVLAKLGVSQAVLVSEGLGVLSEDMDIYFKSLSEMATCRSDVEIIVASLKSYEGKGSFIRFAHALYNGCKKEGEVYNAIVRSGIDVFWNVIEAAAEDNPTNESLSSMKNAEGIAEFDTLKAWSKVSVLLEEQSICPFDFIHGDVELEEAALEVFQFIAMESKYKKIKELSQVMHVAIPFIAKRIAKKKTEVLKAKAQKAKEDELVRMKLPKRNRPLRL